MRRHESMTHRASLAALVLPLVLAAAVLVPGGARAALRVQATVQVPVPAPVRATVVLGDAPRLCVQAKPTAVRTIPAGRLSRRGDDRCRCEERLGERNHHREHRHDRVWVPGHWEQTGRRVARWVPGHWEPRLAVCGR